MSLGKGIRIRVVKKKPLVRKIFDWAWGQDSREYAECIAYIDEDSWKEGVDDMMEWTQLEGCYIW